MATAAEDLKKVERILKVKYGSTTPTIQAYKKKWVRWDPDKGREIDTRTNTLFDLSKVKKIVKNDSNVFQDAFAARNRARTFGTSKPITTLGRNLNRRKLQSAESHLNSIVGKYRRHRSQLTTEGGKKFDTHMSKVIADKERRLNIAEEKAKYTPSTLVSTFLKPENRHGGSYVVSGREFDTISGRQVLGPEKDEIKTTVVDQDEDTQELEKEINKNPNKLFGKDQKVLSALTTSDESVSAGTHTRTWDSDSDKYTLTKVEQKAEPLESELQRLLKQRNNFASGKISGRKAQYDLAIMRAEQAEWRKRFPDKPFPSFYGRSLTNQLAINP